MIVTVQTDDVTEAKRLLTVNELHSDLNDFRYWLRNARKHMDVPPTIHEIWDMFIEHTADYLE
jgi:hypothetical protein